MKIFSSHPIASKNWSKDFIDDSKEGEGAQT